MSSTGRRLRICLITPGHLATNPRIVKEADALTEAGCYVNVIAADYLAWARTADVEFANRPWKARRVPFGPQAPRPRYLMQTLRRHTAKRLVKLAGYGPALVESAIHPISPELVRAAMSVPADLYIAHYVAALPAAARAARFHRGRFAFDAEDFHLGEHSNDPVFSFERSLIRAIESRYLPDSAYLTAASPGIAAAYAETYGLKLPTVVLNVFPRTHAPREATALGAATPRPSVYWFSQTIGPNRGLETAVKALPLSSARPHLYLRGTPVSGFTDTLRALAQECGASGRVHLLEPAPPSEMARLASAYDIGLAGEPGSTRNNSIALGNKLFTYLLAGMPVAASATPAHRSLADAAGAVFLYEPDSPRDLARVLDMLLLDNERLAKARSTAWRLGQDRYNWDVEKQFLLSAVNQAMGGSLTWRE